MSTSKTWIAAALLVTALAGAYVALVPMLSTLGNGPQWPQANATGTVPALQIVVDPTGPNVVSNKRSGGVSVTQVAGTGPTRIGGAPAATTQSQGGGFPAAGTNTVGSVPSGGGQGGSGSGGTGTGGPAPSINPSIVTDSPAGGGAGSTDQASVSATG